MPVQKALKILRWILTIATVGVVLLFCWQCLDIYLMGNRPENISNGVYLSPVYSAQIAAQRLTMVRPVLVIYAVLAAVTVIAQTVAGTAKRHNGKLKPCHPRAHNEKKIAIARLAVLCLGILFIILGVMNGGSRDVLIKAINICTECIGLG